MTNDEVASDNEAKFKLATKIARPNVGCGSSTTIVQRRSFDLFNEEGEMGQGNEQGIGLDLSFL